LIYEKHFQYLKQLEFINGKLKCAFAQQKNILK